MHKHPNRTRAERWLRWYRLSLGPISTVGLSFALPTFFGDPLREHDQPGG